MNAQAQTRTLPQVFALGVTQTIAWASSTYLIAILARPIAEELGLSLSTVFGAFSISLVVMALTGPSAGRAIDTRGGRGVLLLSNVVLAGGLALLGAAHEPVVLFAAWCAIGWGMALGLYDAAFATLVRLHGEAARAPITGITLIAGFASTVGWPLTAFVAERYGWRVSCYAWAVLHIAVALPVNLLFVPKVARRAPSASDRKEASASVFGADAQEKRAFVLLALFAALTAFVTSAMAAHLPGLLVAAGTTAVGAIAAGALLGPAQVAARFLEFTASRRFDLHPLASARIATACHPLAGFALAFFGGPTAVAMAFAVLHGAGNGLITIARGTLPLAIFGAAGYGHRQGVLGVLARAMQALAPYAYGLVLERAGAGAAIALSVGLSLVALATLLVLAAPSTRA
ncbi:MAG TPA: MFS transporter [Burkholderiales bacterium]|nr:MFS transporter [Burkholderiales bacterium]